MSTSGAADDATGRNQLAWDIQEQGGRTYITLSGEVDENTDFAQLRDQLRGDTVFDLRGVQRINSCGVREWVTFFRELASLVRSVTFAACSPAVVQQLCMIHNFRGPAGIASFIAPYVCETCDIEEEKLLTLDEHFPPAALRERRVPEFSCKRCGKPMLFDDIPDRYLSFLDEENGGR